MCIFYALSLRFLKLSESCIFTNHICNAKPTSPSAEWDPTHLRTRPPTVAHLKAVCHWPFPGRVTDRGTYCVHSLCDGWP